MAEQHDQERNLPASPKRLEEARAEGRVARSKELATCLILGGGTAALWFASPSLADRLIGLFRGGLSFSAREASSASAMGERLSHLSFDALLATLPVLAMLLVLSVAGPLAMGGWVFSTKVLSPALNRLNPLSGLGRLFSVDALAELVKAIAKSLLIGGIGAWLIWKGLDPMVDLMQEGTREGMAHFNAMMLRALMILSGGLFVIAMIDAPFQLYRYHSGLRMTLDEAKREARETEGDPQLKARIRSQQREIARKRMMAAVPTADVVVTNPTHYAVALKYQANRGGAPQVVAKGADLIAQRIRELAQTNGVPTLEAPPLARALYRHVDIGEQIPQTLYTAVAQVLAYVHHLRKFNQVGGAVPVAPTDLAVPAELDWPGAKS
jgi:flagellar biosynthesis protein FlhB